MSIWVLGFRSFNSTCLNRRVFARCRALYAKKRKTEAVPFAVKGYIGCRYGCRETFSGETARNLKE